MKEANILILSVGRRVELIRCFKEARESLGLNGQVIAADVTTTAPAIYHADKYHIIPIVSADDFIESVINVCKEENIHLLVPTIDTELQKLSDNKKRIESNTNAKVLVSREEVIKICRDKYNTQDFFEKNGFKMPRLISKSDIQNKNYEFPLFIKPLNGSSSINAFKVNNEKELEFFLEYVPQPIVQEFIEGDEFTVDVFTDFNSNPITIVPRQRLATRSGEVSKGITKKDRDIIDEIKKIIDILKPIGHITIQCIKTKYGIKFIEINPRFGGGAPISIKAGANSPINLYKLLLGEELTYNEEYEENLLALRYDEAVFLNHEGKLV